MDHQSSSSGPGDSLGSFENGNMAAAAATDAVTKTSDVAKQVTAEATRAIGKAGSTVTNQVKEILDRQVGVGAEMVGHFAHSAKRAAEDLEEKAPQAAGLVRGIADRLEDYSVELHDQSVDRLVQRAADFTRRQPALVFGLAALAGFVALRTMKASPSVASPSIQPSQQSRDPYASNSRGL
jgi:hypothetical protein